MPFTARGKLADYYGAFLGIKKRFIPDSQYKGNNEYEDYILRESIKPHFYSQKNKENTKWVWYFYIDLDEI